MKIKTIFLATILACASASAEQKNELPDPPFGTVGAEFCVNGKVERVIWVITQDGHITRFDKDHMPKSSEQQAKLMLWIQSGPTDTVSYPCT